MYEAFYGLREKPFNLTPDPRFLYLSEKHKEAFAHLLYGIKNRTGFIMVSGEVGTGKTTICRTLIGRLDESTDVAFIFNPRLSSRELLTKVNEDFGIRTRAKTIKGLIDELNAYLVERYGRGRNCVLIIDEAQDLELGVLEQIRLLSNLETETQKLLQIVLIGQPELVEHLALPELRQLDQRITARYHLKPLDRDETVQYIAYRLRVAGGRRRLHFLKAAVNEIYRASGGVPRVINSVCDRALLIGYTRETREITKPIVKQAVREIRGDTARIRRRGRFRKYLPSPTLIAVAVLICLFGKYVAEPFAERLRYDPAPPQGTAGQGQPASHGSTASAMVENHSDAIDKTVAEEPPSVLVSFIDGTNSPLARNFAAVSILRAWNLALLGDYPEGDSAESLVAFAGENGLRGEHLRLTLDELERIDLPAFARVLGDTGKAWVGVLGMDEDKVWISTGIADTSGASREEFGKRFLNQAVILWQDPTPDAPVLHRGAQGEPVRRLQEGLRALGRLDAAATGSYGAKTESAIRQIQEETGLECDGVVGTQTRMILVSWLPEFDSPSLLMAESAEDGGEPETTAKLVEGATPPQGPGQEGPADPESVDSVPTPQPEGEPDESAAAPEVPVEEEASEVGPAEPEPGTVPESAAVEANPPQTAPEQTVEPEKSSPSNEDPAQTVEESPSPTEEPALDTEEVTPIVEEPAPNVEEPPPSTGEPSHDEEEPAGASEEPVPEPAPVQEGGGPSESVSRPPNPSPDKPVTAPSLSGMPLVPHQADPDERKGNGGS